MANSTAALRKELALTVTDPFSLLAEALQRNDELRDRVYLLEHALTQAQKKGCSPAAPSRRTGARRLQPVA
jgi:hypothetical protein